IERVTTPREQAGPELKTWAAGRRAALRDSASLRAAAGRALTGFWEQVQASRPQEIGSVSRLREVEKDIATLRANKDRIAKIYPDLEVAIRPAAVAELAATLEARREGLAIQARLDGLQQPAARVESLVTWRERGESLREAAATAAAWAGKHADQAGL